jgi:hypothetical protein
MFGVGWTIAPAPVLAEMQVRGSPEAVRIEAQNSSVEEILAALSRTFGLRYQSRINLDKRRSGSYGGPLPQVVMRILEGYNFILKADGGRLVVTVVGTPEGSATASPSTTQVPVPPTAGAARAPHVVGDVAGPIGAETAMPLPVVDLAKEPSLPTPVLPASGAAPAPMPEPGQSQLSAPSPSASAETLLPQAGPVTGMPPLVTRLRTGPQRQGQ